MKSISLFTSIFFGQICLFNPFGYYSSIITNPYEYALTLALGILFLCIFFYLISKDKKVYSKVSKNNREDEMNAALACICLVSVAIFIIFAIIIHNTYFIV